MRILCRSGHYSFFPRNEEDVNRFCMKFKVEMVKERDYYTFSSLAGSPDFSIKGMMYKNLVSIKTFEGDPWDVMRENGFVYSLDLKLLVPKESISIVSDPAITGFYWSLNSPIFQAGSLNVIGKRIMSFDGEFNFDIGKTRVRSFGYE